MSNNGRVQRHSREIGNDGRWQATAVHPPPVHPRARQYTQSVMPHVIPDESELTAGVRIQPGESYGFFTDTSVCIGCKACEVACKEWNTLPAEALQLTGMSYDNTAALGATTWRHVEFVEEISDGDGRRATVMLPFQSHWLMMSDVCKHCQHAGCLEACPTGALFRTEFGTVVVQNDVCNGCGYCVPACPFGVIATSEVDGKAHKCTLCYDRLKGGLEPACAKACPTNSIQFGEVTELRHRARRRLADLLAQGVDNAYLYGVSGGPGATGGIKGLNAFFLLLDHPEVYGLPEQPVLPSSRVFPGLVTGMLTMASFGLAAAMTFVAGRRS
jgi:formate dehydrogenase iron-sulfur subunit